MASKKIKLPPLSALGQKFTISLDKSEITYNLGLSFSSEEDACAFYEQFSEKFIGAKNFREKEIMEIEVPHQVGSKWLVSCLCKLNEKNNFASWIPASQNIEKELSIKDVSLSQAELDELKALYYDKWQYILGLWTAYFDFSQKKLAELFAKKPQIIKHPSKPNTFEYSHEVSIKKAISQDKFSFFPTQANPEDYKAEGEFSSIQNTEFCAPGYPDKPEPWPFNRRYTDYATLLEVQTEQSLHTKEHVNNYLKELPENPKIIELGPGAGYAGSDTKKIRPDSTIIAIATQSVADENRDSFNQIYYGPVPNNTKLLQDHIGTADCVLDVFGPGTYAKNPIHALIYAALLLAENGKFFGITSGKKDPHDFDASPLGNGKNRLELMLFFEKYLGITLSIEKTKVASQVEVGSIVEDFCISFTKTPHAKRLTTDDFIPLCKLADKIIGTPAIIKDPQDSFGKYNRYSIERFQYINATASFFNKQTQSDAELSNVSAVFSAQTELN